MRKDEKSNVGLYFLNSLVLPIMLKSWRPALRDQRRFQQYVQLHQMTSNLQYQPTCAWLQVKMAHDIAQTLVRLSRGPWF
jgi:hypothetical protein